MTSVGEKAASILHSVWGLLRIRRDTTPIDSVAKLNDFVATRSAYIAQKTLYGYVKARMGIRYPAMFEDAKVIASLNIAKLYVFAACLSDLTIYAVANALHDQPFGNNEPEEFARRCYESGLRANTDKAPEQFSLTGCIDEFNRRLSETDWRTSARQPENFTDSPQALFRWAPIADKLKNFDGEIIENSIKFAWRDIREQFQKRIDAAAVSADWSRQTVN
jgi:hypothetical protein